MAPSITTIIFVILILSILFAITIIVVIIVTIVVVVVVSYHFHFLGCKHALPPVSSQHAGLRSGRAHLGFMNQPLSRSACPDARFG